MLKQKQPLRILFASRLVYEKGVDILIDVIESSMNDQILRDSVLWTICSDGPYEGKIRELIQRYPKTVSYLGKVTHTQMKELYKNSDFLYMPSRFLETFGLTALESLSFRTPVIGSRKGGLLSFIPEELAIDEQYPIESTIAVIHKYSQGDIPQALDVSQYSGGIWKEHLSEIFSDSRKIFFLHDYHELIGGAEYYVAQVSQSLRTIGKRVEYYSYSGKTTIWKRRWMFILSIIAFWRFFSVERKLREFRPDTIWMHSILRYIGPWGLLAVRKYTQKYPQTHIYLSHHDVGLLAPFPQYITNERQIPQDGSLSRFLPQELSFLRKCMSVFKWCYIYIIKRILPKKSQHIIFAPFLESSIHRHFPDQKVMVFPHSVNTL